MNVSTNILRRSYFWRAGLSLVLCAVAHILIPRIFFPAFLPAILLLLVNILFFAGKNGFLSGLGFWYLFYPATELRQALSGSIPSDFSSILPVIQWGGVIAFIFPLLKKSLLQIIRPPRKWKSALLYFSLFCLTLCTAIIYVLDPWNFIR